MTAKRSAEAIWEGTLTEGAGIVNLDSGAVAGLDVTWAARTEQSDGKTSPEELIAAAHASCFAMALSGGLARNGTPPQSLHVHATATLDKTDRGLRITKMLIGVRGKVDGVDERQFEEAAATAKEGCPVSNALQNNLDIELKASLE